MAQQQQQQQQLSPRSHPVLLEQDHNNNNNKARSNGEAAASTRAGTSFLLSPQPLLVSSTASSTTSSTSSTTPGPALDTSVAQLRPQHLAPTDPATINTVASSPHSPSLRLQTKGLRSTGAPRRVVSSSSSSSGTQQQLQHPAIPEEMDGSFSDNLSPSRARSTSVSSCYSPGADPINQMTPLPSPLASCDSPGPWNQFRTLSRNPSLTGRTTPAPPRAGTSALVTASGESLDAALAAQSQRKAHQNYRPPAPQPQFSFNSANAPKLDFESTLPIPIRRSLSKNGHERSPSLPAFDSSTRLHREKHLAQRRRTLSSADSSPYLSGSVTSLSSVSSIETALDPEDRNLRLIKKQKLESFEARSIKDDKIRRWRGLRLLGQGAFSKVILATSDDIPDEVDHVHDEGVVVDDEPVTLNPRKYVAVKIVEHGAAGAESKERVESGLKRELDILKTVHHPCLVRLKAFSIEPSRALLVLNFCAGGDLFDVADTFQLAPRLIQRMFAEIVSALRYLHQNGIVHRDVKLENVLINLTRSQLQSVSESPYDYPHPITTLTDVGLSRRVDFDNDDLLTTRCGSDDYASPELIMAMPYDGRQTDAWALGVLLYALLEGRLPFDPPPGSKEQKMRSKTAHRIARCEWKWVKLLPPQPGGDATASYDPILEGGKKIVTNLLKRALKRWKLEQVEEDEWVKNAITVPIKETEE